MMKAAQRELHDYISETSERAEVRAGATLPLGTQERGGGANFAIFNRHASRIQLELFDHPEDAVPARVSDLDTVRNRTGDVWHVWVKRINAGQLYAYPVDGPYAHSERHRFNFNRLLLDPCAVAISQLPQRDFASARGYDVSAPEQGRALSKQANASSMPKCVFVNEAFDWDGDQPIRHPWSKTVIYETHVRGFTIHPKSEVDHPGTYRGLTEKIPYLNDLGVTAVEPLPVQKFNEMSVTRGNPQTDQPLTEDAQSALCLMFNAGDEAVDFGLPHLLPRARWHLATDTSHEAPQDLFAAGEEPLLENSQAYHLSPRSSVILLARCTNRPRSPTALTETK